MFIGPNRRPGPARWSARLIWATVVIAGLQVRHLPVVTNVHVLVICGLIVGGVGALMGVLLGLEYSFGVFLPLPGERVGIHAGMMDTYLLLVASAIVEWFVRRDELPRWTRSGVV